MPINNIQSGSLSLVIKQALTLRLLRLTLTFFLFLLIYDGALRKWVFPNAEMLLFIAKDGVILLAVLFIMTRDRLIAPWSLLPSVKLFFVLYASWVVLEAGNFNLPNILVGIWGVKSHLLYAALILLVPPAFRDLKQAFVILEKYYPWIVIPVCTLAFVQLNMPVDSFLNQQVRGGLAGVSFFGSSNLVRVTGTFSYITGMASFVQVITLLGMGLFCSGARSRYFIIGLGFALSVLPATGSRSVIVITAIAVVILVVTAYWARIARTRMVLKILLITVILLFISFKFQSDTWEALEQRAVHASYDQNRAGSAFTNAFDYLDVAGLFGFGSGSTNLAAPALVKDMFPFSWLPTDVFFEEESGRIVLELGVLGALCSFAMRVSMLVWSFIILGRGKTREIRSICVLVLPVMALGVYVGNGVFSPPVGAAYYWFCVALLGMAQFEQLQATRRNK